MRGRFSLHKSFVFSLILVLKFHLVMMSGTVDSC